MSILPTRIHRSKAIPTKTQQDTEMVSKCLQQREKGNPGTCHATLETYCRDTLSRQSGTDRGTHRENSRTVRCTNSQTHSHKQGQRFFSSVQEPVASCTSGQCSTTEPHPSADKDAEITEGKTAPSASTRKPTGKRQRKVLRKKGPYFVHSVVLSTIRSKRHVISTRETHDKCEIVILKFLDNHSLARCVTQSPECLT